MKTRTVLGVNIGGTKCSVAVGMAEKGKLTVQDTRDFNTGDYRSPERVIEKLCTEAENIVKGHEITAVGISCGGPLDSGAGIILSPPNLPGWDNVRICECFQNRFSVPAFLQNDANAGAVAEWMYGAGRGTENFIFLTFGTGLGAGIILNGRLYSGKQDMAGELGHWRMSAFGPVGYGKSASLEGFCSGGGIEQLARQKLLELKQLGRIHPLMSVDLSARDVFVMAAENDPLCMDIVNTVGETFGMGLAMLIDLLNPEIIAAGSIFTRNYDFLCPIVMRVVEREALSVSVKNCKILPSSLGEEIGNISALSTALYAY